MFKSKKPSKEAKLFLMQSIVEIIKNGDLNAVNQASFYTAANNLLWAGLTTHEDTKNSESYTNLSILNYKMPLVFFAVIYNRPEIFKALLSMFSADLVELKDGLTRGNILHHMYSDISCANPEMHQVVFDCLEKNYSFEAILTMINTKNSKNLSVIDHAKDYGINMEPLIAKIAKYQPAEQQIPVAEAVLVEGAMANPEHYNLSLFPKRYPTIERMNSADAAAAAADFLVDLMNYKGGYL